MSARTQRQKRTRREPTATALACEHCSRDRVCAPVGAFQELNRQMPMPGLAPQLAAIEALYGANVSVMACIYCACFQPVGVESHGH